MANYAAIIEEQHKPKLQPKPIHSTHFPTTPPRKQTLDKQIRVNMGNQYQKQALSLAKRNKT